MDLSLNRQRYPDHPFQTDDDCVRYTLHQLEGTDVKLMYRNYTADLRNKYIDMRRCCWKRPNPEALRRPDVNPEIRKT